MIEFMPESNENILGVRASGKLTDDDYKNVLVPKLESLLEHHSKLRVLFYMDENFRGWDLKSAWDNTTLDVKHRGDFEKIAMVGAPAWEEWCVKIAAVLMKGRMRTFRSDELDRAWEWVRE
jgi:hypothetical protein